MCSIRGRSAAAAGAWYWTTVSGSAAGTRRVPVSGPGLPEVTAPRSAGGALAPYGQHEAQAAMCAQRVDQTSTWDAHRQRRGGPGPQHGRHDRNLDRLSLHQYIHRMHHAFRLGHARRPDLHLSPVNKLPRPADWLPNPQASRL